MARSDAASAALACEALRAECAAVVGRCSLTVSKPVLKALWFQRLEATI